jgi:hypothetical protein
MDLAVLQKKLPEMMTWIEQTLAPHRATARPVADLGFPRLAHYYSAPLLGGSRVILVDECPVPPLSRMGLDGFEDFENLHAAGITYGPYFFVRRECAHDESLHFHELVHVVQWAHLGPQKFVMAYALGHLAAGSYRQNPLEVMAYDFQDQFDRRALAFDAGGRVRTECDRVVPELFKHFGL